MKGVVMQIQKNKKKEELKSDPLVDSLVQAKEYVNKNSSTLTTIVVICAVVVAGIVIYRNNRSRLTFQAQEAFGKAMVAYTTGDMTGAVNLFTEVKNNYMNSPYASYSNLLLGSIAIKEQKYAEAETFYREAVASGKNKLFIAAGAKEGLAAACEWNDKDNQALSLYDEILQDGEYIFRHADIRWKAALLNRRLGNTAKTVDLCNTIVADTAATTYHQKAQNLLAEIECEKQG